MPASPSPSVASAGACNLCRHPLTSPIHALAGDASITSLNTIGGEAQRIWFYNRCSHVMTDPLRDISAFYGEHYDLGLNPQVAQSAMREISAWQSRNLHYHYLF